MPTASLIQKTEYQVPNQDLKQIFKLVPDSANRLLLIEMRLISGPGLANLMPRWCAAHSSSLPCCSQWFPGSWGASADTEMHKRAGQGQLWLSWNWGLLPNPWGQDPALHPQQELWSQPVCLGKLCWSSAHNSPSPVIPTASHVHSGWNQSSGGSQTLVFLSRQPKSETEASHR